MHHAWVNSSWLVKCNRWHADSHAENRGSYGGLLQATSIHLVSYPSLHAISYHWKFTWSQPCCVIGEDWCDSYLPYWYLAASEAQHKLSTCLGDNVFQDPFQSQVHSLNRGVLPCYKTSQPANQPKHAAKWHWHTNRPRRFKGNQDLSTFSLSEGAVPRCSLPDGSVLSGVSLAWPPYKLR